MSVFESDLENKLSEFSFNFGKLFLQNIYVKVVDNKFLFYI